jgi:hypothetical protein
MVPAERQQILVAGDNDPGFHGDSGGNHVIIVRIAGAQTDVRQRTYKQPGDPLQIRAPRTDCFVAMAVAVPPTR